MPRGGRRFTAQQKVAIVRQHLVEKKPLSELCKEHKIDVSTFHRWQKELFENAAAALEPRCRRTTDAKDREVAFLKQKLQRKHEVLSEIMEEHIRLKKELGEL